MAWFKKPDDPEDDLRDALWYYRCYMYHQAYMSLENVLVLVEKEDFCDKNYEYEEGVVVSIETGGTTPGAAVTPGNDAEVGTGGLAVVVEDGD